MRPPLAVSIGCQRTRLPEGLAGGASLPGRSVLPRILSTGADGAAGQQRENSHARHPCAQHPPMPIDEKSRLTRSEKLPYV